jgi:diphosphomevalonate decarboxylase
VTRGASQGEAGITVRAHANIALAKYWGKRAGAGNYPAVPSLSVTLDGLSTTTTVRFDQGADVDSFVLGGRPADPRATARVVELLDRVRRAAKVQTRAVVTSRNDFPTASGLASSASGFAALALAAVRAAGLDWDMAAISDLARRSSASSARSLFGGYVRLDAGPTGDAAGVTDLAARPVVEGDPLAMAMLVCVTREGEKAVSSTEGMGRTAAESPYFAAWLDHAPRLCDRLEAALRAGDFPEVGQLTESSFLAMHASAIAAGVVYWEPASLAVLAAVRGMRSDGQLAFATMDAGPHVKVMVPMVERAAACARLGAAPGVLRILETKPGEAARVVDTVP